MNAQDPTEKLMIHLAEGVSEEIALEVGPRRVETANPNHNKEEIITMITKGIQLYIGMILSLSCAILASAKGTTAVVVLIGILFVLELLETSVIPDRKKILALVMLSGSILLISVLEVANTIGSNFNMNTFYLVVMLVGSLLMFIEAVRAVLPKSSAK